MQYDLAARLEELEFDVSDRLSMFLCGRAPEHIKSVHFLVPELVSPSTASVRQFRRQLQAATSVLFEKLIQDVYDEVNFNYLKLFFVRLHIAGRST